MSRKFVVGLTGGIGSGKTAASDCFAALDIGVVDADLVSRACVMPGEQALTAIADHFGANILQPDGTLNRALLRQLVFAKAQERQWLEQLLHPLIGARIEKDLSGIDSPYAILVSPLLLETNQRQWVNRVLLIDSPEEAQITRTMARDNNDRKQVESIIATQMPRQDKRAAADDVLMNDSSLKILEKKIYALHRKYLNLATEVAIQ